MNSRLMYIELKTDGLQGPARIGRVEFSQTGKTLYYAGRELARRDADEGDESGSE